VTTFAAARADLLHASQVLGHAERGEAIARNLDLRLARLQASAPPDRTPVMYLSAGGAVAGSGTLTDAAIDAAGGRNVRSDHGWQVMPLEDLVKTPPALIALGFFGAGRERMNAWSPSRHPALRNALAHAHTVSLPPAAISCEAWTMIDAAEIIAAGLRAP
jgi:iron complex transport system substrate-binding protein